MVVHRWLRRTYFPQGKVVSAADGPIEMIVILSTAFTGLAEKLLARRQHQLEGWQPTQSGLHVPQFDRGTRDENEMVSVKEGVLETSYLFSLW
jgi:hypothetical protein